MFHRPVVGIDVAKNFSYCAAVSPNVTPFFSKPIKVFHTKQGLLFLLDQIKKVEEAFHSKPAIVLESTGHYSQRIVHFFLKQGFEVFLINPLISHSIKNSTVRKVKTDAMDALELAKLPFLQKLHGSYMPNEAFANLKVLARTRFQIAEHRSKLVNQFVAAIEQVAPTFPNVLDPTSLTALTLLASFSSPAEWLDPANRHAIITLLETLPRRGKEYARSKYEALLECAVDAEYTGIELSANYTAVQLYAKNVAFLDEQIKVVDREIETLAASIPEVQLLKSISGIGDVLAPLIAGEVGEIKRFLNAKQLVAYCGIDPAVRQSGNFIGTKNKVTKRGSPFLRKALYVAAATAIRKGAKGDLVNPILYEYYQKKTQSKPRKQALGAIMNKLVRIIFSVLKHRQPYRQITAEQQIEIYQMRIKKAA